MNKVVTPVSVAFGEESPVISRRELKTLMKRSNKPGLIHLSLWVMLLCCTALLLWLSLHWLWLLIPALFLHGVVMVHHFALQHECSHYTAFRSRTLCNVLAGICGFLLFIPPRFFRYEHCDHHTYTNLEGRDPEMVPLPHNRWQYAWYLSAIPYWYSQFSGLIRRARGKITPEEKRFLPTVERAAIVRESRLMVAAYLLVCLVSSLSSWVPVLMFWWLPMLLAEPVMRYIRMTEHVARPMVSDRQLNTRTNLVARCWQFLAWNMNYHAEHHYASSVPFHALRQLHEKLQGHVFVEVDGYRGAHRDIVSAIDASSPARSGA